MEYKGGGGVGVLEMGGGGSVKCEYSATGVLGRAGPCLAMSTLVLILARSKLFKLA
jgi:hypothetical protein